MKESSLILIGDYFEFDLCYFLYIIEDRKAMNRFTQGTIVW